MGKIKLKLIVEKGGEKFVFEKEAYNLEELKEGVSNYIEVLVLNERAKSSAERSFGKGSEIEGGEAGKNFVPEFIPGWLKDYDIENLSQKEKLLLLIKHEHANSWVRSQELREEYRDIFGEDIKLSSISTYLARFYEEGILRRRGSRAQREYILSELATA